MKRPMVAAFDLVTSLLLIFVIMAIVSTPKKTTSIDTLGTYAVVMYWANGSNDDVDLYVRDPKGQIAFFVNQNAGQMHLEHDDQGTRVSQTRQNQERVVLRGTEPGEYIANVQMYAKNDPGSTPVTVELWRLRGDDKKLLTKHVVLASQGQEATAFRFDDKGNYRGDLPRKFVGAAIS